MTQRLPSLQGDTNMLISANSRMVESGCLDWPRRIILALICLVLLSHGSVRCEADESESAALNQSFQQEVRPLVTRLCAECHSTKQAEADLDLTTFTSLSDVRKNAPIWQRVLDMIDSGQMPPVDANQPNAAERTALLGWVQTFLTIEARAHEGDPGPVILRRLSNAEYTYTLRDLTGIETLNPAAEFPVDGAAGEGFTNTGHALVMSPALLTKYLDAAKGISAHIVLLPDGFRFSPATSQLDFTDEMLTRIREFYGRYTEARSGDKVNLQGIVFNTNGDGALPLGRYLLATVEERESLRDGSRTIGQVAADRQLSSKYLALLWRKLNEPSDNPVLEQIRTKWAGSPSAAVPALVDEIGHWQSGLWKFSSVGHIGKVNGPRQWQEPVIPLAAVQTVRFKIPESTGGQPITIAMKAGDAGDGHAEDMLIWERPRLVAPGRPELLLKDLRQQIQIFEERRERVFAETSRCLDAVAAAIGQPADPVMLARSSGVNADSLQLWMSYLGVGAAPTQITDHFQKQLKDVQGKSFISGWGSDETPLCLANSSDMEAHIPGHSAPHGIVLHPSPQLAAAIAWQSPVDTVLNIHATVRHAHTACGNGVTWMLELRKNGTRQTLSSGATHGAAPASLGPFEKIAIRKGDVVALLIGPRDGNHSCDLTAVDLTLTSTDPALSVWDLAADVSPDILAANPHADRQGHSAVWHFFTEPVSASDAVNIPADSLLARWQTTSDAAEKHRLAEEIQQLLAAACTLPPEHPDAALHRELTSFDGPLFRRSGEQASPAREQSNAANPQNTSESTTWGLASSLFGKTPDGLTIDPGSLAMTAPSVIQFQLPAGLATGYELVVDGRIETTHHPEGTVQLAVESGNTALPMGITTGAEQDLSQLSHLRFATASAPVVVRMEGNSAQSFQNAFDEFRELFPIALCYPKIVPVDETVTLTLFYREDDHLIRLMLDEKEHAELDRLWEELHYISQDALTQLDVLAQLLEFASQDGDPRVFEPFKIPLQQRAAAFRETLQQSEGAHLDQLMKFTELAYRRPLTAQDHEQLRQLYQTLRTEELTHADAIKLTLARVLLSPDFLYHVEIPMPGEAAHPVSDWELASRLSYFLWASGPDEELRTLAKAGSLHEPEVLSAQVKRMLADARTRRLAIEFACQWLHIYEFDQHDEKSEQQFPEFNALRGAMYEESIRFFVDLFQNNRSILQILDADETFLNEPLARHYGVEGVNGPDWQRVTGMKERHRGGILAQATTLSKQSGASRTSPTLRGSWISEVLLGERLPRPPKGIPPIPDDPAAFAGLTVRQIVEKHASDPRCAVCHIRVDPMGFALENFDAVGRYREKEAGDLSFDTGVVMADGTRYSGLDGLRDYLLHQRRDAFVRQFSRKMLGYALGRAVQLSDEPLLTAIQTDLQSNDYRVDIVIERIVQSPQFREIRGRDTVVE